MSTSLHANILILINELAWSDQCMSISVCTDGGGSGRVSGKVLARPQASEKENKLTYHSIVIRIISGLYAYNRATLDIK